MKQNQQIENAPKTKPNNVLSYLAWSVTLVATVGNLFFSEVLELPPCVLFIPESIAPCQAGVSCTSRQNEWLGFITIPLMALTAFTAIALCLLFYKSEEK